MRRIVTGLSVLSLAAFLMPVRADEDAKLQEVIDRAIKAHGGSENLKKYQAVIAKSKGKFHGFGEAVDYTGTDSMQLPNRIRLEVKSQFGGQDFTFIQVVNRDKGWIKIGEKTEELDKDMLAEVKEQLNAANITHLICLKNRDYKLSSLGESKVGDRPDVGIRVERKGYREVNLFFDKEKALLLKMETRGKDPMRGEEFTATTVYSAYKKVEEMMYPHKITIKHDGKPFVEGETLEVKFFEKLEDNVFEKP